MPWAWAVNSHMAPIKKVELIRKRGGTCIIAVLSPWRPRPPPCGAPRIAPFWEATSRGRLRCAWTSACWTPGYLEEGGRAVHWHHTERVIGWRYRGGGHEEASAPLNSRLTTLTCDRPSTAILVFRSIGVKWQGFKTSYDIIWKLKGSKSLWHAICGVWTGM